MFIKDVAKKNKKIKRLQLYLDEIIHGGEWLAATGYDSIHMFKTIF